MRMEKGKMKDIKIAYIGGGSRGWAWTFMTDLSLEPQLSGTISLYDIDHSAAEQNQVIGSRINGLDQTLSQWEYKVEDTLEGALKEADFVVISILPGTFEEMAIDVHHPEQYGIYQSVGDTAGPGGMMRALRTIPMYVTIAEAIKKVSPQAWVINYTNPMSLCVKTLYHVFPEIKAFGCCHEVFGTQATLLGILKDYVEGLESEKRPFEMKDIQREDIHVNVMGINHFTWFDQATCKGLDLFPIYQNYISHHQKEGYFDPTDDHFPDTCFMSKERVKFDLFQQYGLIAAAGDRHLAEFMPGNQYLNNPETVDSWDFHLTTVEWRQKDLKERLEKGEAYASGESVIPQQASTEEGILLIKALCGLTRVVSNVNIPNTGQQISNISPNAIVETNAVFSKDSVRPIHAGQVPQRILDLTQPHLDNHELILKAALEGNRDLALKALLQDPLSKDKLDEATGRKMLEEMLEGTKAYLPTAWFEH